MNSSPSQSESSKDSSKPKTRVIFLDVDGVICTDRSYLAYDVPNKRRMWNAWDEVACTVIREACKTGIQIVVSSTWRHPKHEVELMEHLTKHNLIEYLRRPNWKTLDLAWEDGSIRGHEIARYLADNPDIEDYKILDDVMQFLESQRDHLIFTDCDNGMNGANMRELLRWARVLKH